MMKHHDKSVEFCRTCGEDTSHNHIKLPPDDEEVYECSMCGTLKVNHNEV